MEWVGPTLVGLAARVRDNLLRKGVCRRASPALAAILFLAGGATAAPASPRAACAHAYERVTVDALGGDPVLISAGPFGEILVSGVPCGLATVDNTTKVVVRGGLGPDTVVLDEGARPLASTLGIRVKVSVALGAGRNVLVLLCSGNPDYIAAGTKGVALSAGASRPDVRLDGVTELRVRPGAGADVVTTAGSSIADAPLSLGGPFPAPIVVHGDAGDDVIGGGPFADRLGGGGGSDVVAGGAGPDVLAGGADDDRLLGYLDDDALRGGGGTDTCFQYAGSGLRRSCELPANRSPLPASPPRQLFVVNQNLEEVHPRPLDGKFPWLYDLQSHKELTNFTRRLPLWLPYAPDVMLLQEVDGPVAKQVAARLSNLFNDRYAAVILPDRPLVTIQAANGTTHRKWNTAVVINQQRVRFVRGGYVRTSQKERDRTEGIKTIQHHAHALITERHTRMRAAVVAIHFNSNNFFTPEKLGEPRRVEWSRNVATFVRRRYEGADVTILGGEFCTRRCTNTLRERVVCEESRMWTMLTEEFHYRDSVYEANNSSDADIGEQATSNHGLEKRIDYIFTSGRVLAASRDVGYRAFEGDRDYISDHKGDYALVAQD
jgi:hypothetical protein